VNSVLSLALVIAISLFGLGFAWWLKTDVLAEDVGTPKMQESAGYIKEGAEAFMRRQYSTIYWLTALSALAILLLYGLQGGPHSWKMGFKTTISFLIGAGCSLLSGWIGMWVAIRTNIRTAAAAQTSLNRALQVALRGGAVSGLAVVALSLLGVSITYILMGADPKVTPHEIVGFGFGASFVALFAQLGGGIYTKAADMGADLVGKVEAGIPEDDPRNPAVIADLVGDNVGDCAGRGADLFESTAAENIGAMILGIALYDHYGVNGILFPLVVRAFGLLASIVGVMVVKMKDEESDPMDALNFGFIVTAVLAAVGFWISTRYLLQTGDSKWLFVAGVVGIFTSLVFVWITQYYTEYKYRPVKEIAEASLKGPATAIVAGMAVGLECTFLPVLVISFALMTSFKLGQWAIGPDGGLYGTAVATMGMLGTAGYILAMDTFGPITDNAGGIIEMSGADESIRKRTDRLDSVGNTTKALTKGYAIGSAALAAFLLFSAYMDEVSKLQREHGVANWQFTTVDIAKVDVFVGGMLGAVLSFLFAALAIRAVGNTAGYVIEEVRRQFKDEGIMKGTTKPDYASCVDITTQGALKNMVLPGAIAVLFPILVGLLLKKEAMASFLMVGTISGIILATFLNNSGGAWDNAKKYIETGVHGGKRSEAHKAAVVGDTVGDPFKDTAGPSLHVLIKLLATITLVMAPLFL
jgi:K(+)-stimulated pyrophosphate-energized sodium pump